jgi:hypothetical protein
MIKFEQLAKFAHSVLAAYSESIGEEQTAWDNMDPEAKQSFRRGIEAHQIKPDMSEGEAHAHWINEKDLDGWQWGAEKDEKKKQHPNMVPYNELPENQKAKATIFKSIVNNLSSLIE